MQAVLHTDYFGIAHDETRSSIPSGLRALCVNFFGKNRKTLSQIFFDFAVKKICTRLIKDFGTLSLELEGIHTKLSNGELSTEDIEDDYKTTQSIISLLTSADELFNEIDYFDNVLLRNEVKNVLNTSYLIEVELKDLVFQNKKSPFLKDEMFQSLANKSKDSLSRIA